MLKSQWILGAALLASTSVAANAQPAPRAVASAKKSARASLIVCPITQEVSTPSAGSSVKFNGETVYFCCAGCKGEFASLSAAQKKSRVAQAKKLAAKANAKASAKTKKSA